MESAKKKTGKAGGKDAVEIYHSAKGLGRYASALSS